MSWFKDRVKYRKFQNPTNIYCLERCLQILQFISHSEIGCCFFILCTCYQFCYSLCIKSYTNSLCKIIYQESAKSITKKYGSLNLLINASGVLSIPEVMQPGTDISRCITQDFSCHSKYSRFKLTIYIISIACLPKYPSSSRFLFSFSFFGANFS